MFEVGQKAHVRLKKDPNEMYEGVVLETSETTFKLENNDRKFKYSEIIKK